MVKLAILLSAVTCLIISQAESYIEEQRVLIYSAFTTEKPEAVNSFVHQLSPRQIAKRYAGPSGLRGPPGPQSDIYGIGPSYPRGSVISGPPGIAIGRREDKVSIDHRGRIRPAVRTTGKRTV